VDYADPIIVKDPREHRGYSTNVYLYIFVCTATKALHLELSSDLSTEKFLLAFTRFSARHGPIMEMHSDCGTDFVVASRILTSLQEFTQSNGFQENVKCPTSYGNAADYVVLQSSYLSTFWCFM
jgi:hypothetical protein